jgi:hypothetical protein
MGVEVQQSRRIGEKEDLKILFSKEMKKVLLEKDQ